MLWQIFKKIEPYLLKTYKKISLPPIPNFTGDRDIEYSFIAANMPDGPGEALDFGCAQAYTGLIAARKGFRVTALDINSQPFLYQHINFKFIKGDLLNMSFREDSFDLIINCSTIEHIGLAGRYGIVEARCDGDIDAMVELKKVLKPGGNMLLTLPVGIDQILIPTHRVYGEIRLPKLLNGWEIVKKEFWTKNSQNCWQICDESTALKIKTSKYFYGLGLYVLRPSKF